MKRSVKDGWIWRVKRSIKVGGSRGERSIKIEWIWGGGKVRLGGFEGGGAAGQSRSGGLGK